MPNILTEIYKASPNIQKAGGKKMVKKTANKKPAAKKSTAKKTPAKKTPAKKSTAKKTPAKKSTAKKSAPVKKKTVTKCPPGCVKKPVKKNQKGGGNKPINLQQAVQVLRDYYNNKYE